MDPSANRSPSLGDVIRQARQAGRLSPEALGQPEFKACYVQAVEDGRVYPSRPTLELFAGRLRIPVAELLNAAAPDIATPDLAALKEDLAYQIDRARRVTDSGHADEAVAMLTAAEQAYLPYLPQITGYTVYRLYYGRGAAYIRWQRPADAQQDLKRALDLALALAKRLPERAEAVEQARNALGAAFYQQDDYLQALDHHTRCLHAIQMGVVQDLNLRVLIYSNLANDYWALNDINHAIGMYKEALMILEEDVSNQERRLGVYWGLSLAYKAQEDLVRAVLYARRALGVCEATENAPAAAQMRVNLAELLTARQEYREAERLLDLARAFHEKIGDTVALSVDYQQNTRLALAQDQLPQAAEYARQSMQFVDEAYQALDRQDAGAHANVVRAHARALMAAGLVAERTGAPAGADAHFQQAVALMEPLTPNETGYEVCYTYADLLKARDDHKQAVYYYRLAAKHRRRPKPRSKGDRAVR